MSMIHARSATAPARMGMNRAHADGGRPRRSRSCASYGARFAGAAGDGATFTGAGCTSPARSPSTPEGEKAFVSPPPSGRGGLGGWGACGFKLGLRDSCGRSAGGVAEDDGDDAALLPDAAVVAVGAVGGGGGGSSRSPMPSPSESRSMNTGTIISLFAGSSSRVSGAVTTRMKICRSPVVTGCQSTHTSSSAPRARTEKGGGVPIAVPFSEKKTFPCTSRSPTFFTVA